MIDFRPIFLIIGFLLTILAIVMMVPAAVDVFEYHPTQNTLTEILSTGNLNLITNDSLRYELLNWSAEFDELDEAWKTLDDFNQHMVIPYLTENASMKNISRPISHESW